MTKIKYRKDYWIRRPQVLPDFREYSYIAKLQIVKLADNHALIGDKTQREIAAYYNIPKKRLEKWRANKPLILRRAEEEAARAEDRYDAYRQAQEKKRLDLTKRAIRLMRQGHSAQMTARKLGVTKSEIAAWVWEYWFRKLEQSAKDPYTKNVRRPKSKFQIPQDWIRRMYGLENLHIGDQVTKKVRQQLGREYERTTVHQRMLLKQAADLAYIADLCMTRIEELRTLIEESDNANEILAAKLALYDWSHAYVRIADRMGTSLKRAGIKLGAPKTRKRLLRAGKVKLHAN